MTNRLNTLLTLGAIGLAAAGCNKDATQSEPPHPGDFQLSYVQVHLPDGSQLHLHDHSEPLDGTVDAIIGTEIPDHMTSGLTTLWAAPEFAHLAPELGILSPESQRAWSAVLQAAGRGAYELARTRYELGQLEEDQGE